MPAIQPARLKTQISGLCKIYRQPEIFVRMLTEMLEFYADRTRRQGIVVSSAMLMNTLGVPKPVIHHLSIELKLTAREYPEATLSICDKLFNQPYLEYRLIAANLLGSLPPSMKDDVLDRIDDWHSGTFDESSARFILQYGLTSLVKDNPGELLKTADRWLSSTRQVDKQYAILLLEILVDSQDFTNHPMVFRLIAPLIRNTPLEVRYLMPSLIRVLATRGPHETAYVLLEALQASENPDAEWITRQSIKHFPKEFQSQLRSMLRQKQIPAQNDNDIN